MTTREFIESLKLRDNIFELNEDTVVSYLIHFAAPFTGEDKICIPAGTKFAPYGLMRDDAMYMVPIEPEDNLYASLDNQTKAKYTDLSNRIQGYTFFITEAELKEWNINFTQGSKQRLLKVFHLFRLSNNR